MDFKDEEKIACFDKIAELYFNKNFGSTSKSDFETLLFSEYIEHLIKNQLPFDDYTLSKQLGISQSRIRSLKERKELKYPQIDNDYWKNAFIDSLKNAKYTKTDHCIKTIIEDINVMNEVRHYIESKGWFDECSLNKKLLKIPLDCFYELNIDKLTNEDSVSFDTSKILSEHSRKEIEKEVQKLEHEDKAITNFLSDFSQEGLKRLLMSASKEAIGLVLSTLPFGGTAKTVFDILINVINKA